MLHGARFNGYMHIKNTRYQSAPSPANIISVIEYIGNIKRNHTQIITKQLRIKVLETPLDNSSKARPRTMRPHYSIDKMIITSAQVEHPRDQEGTRFIRKNYIESVLDAEVTLLGCRIKFAKLYPSIRSNKALPSLEPLSG